MVVFFVYNETWWRGGFIRSFIRQARIKTWFQLYSNISSRSTAVDWSQTSATNHHQYLKFRTRCVMGSDWMLCGRCKQSKWMLPNECCLPTVNAANTWNAAGVCCREYAARCMLQGECCLPTVNAANDWKPQLWVLQGERCPPTVNAENGWNSQRWMLLQVVCCQVNAACLPYMLQTTGYKVDVANNSLDNVKTGIRCVVGAEWMLRGCPGLFRFEKCVCDLRSDKITAWLYSE